MQAGGILVSRDMRFPETGHRKRILLHRIVEKKERCQFRHIVYGNGIVCVYGNAVRDCDSKCKCKDGADHGTAQEV